jgi:Zn-finger nucleic acid-binding protein
MKCPKCHADLQTQNDRGVQVEACPICQGMWFTPAALDQLENEAFSDEDNKGSLYLASEPTTLKCPVCSAALQRFDYRFYDLQIDCCPDHGFWLDKDEDNQILELMSGEEARVEREFSSEDSWAKYINHLRSPSFFTKIKSIFRP